MSASWKGLNSFHQHTWIKYWPTSTSESHSSSVIFSPRFIITCLSSDLEINPLPSWKLEESDKDPIIICWPHRTQWRPLWFRPPPPESPFSPPPWTGSQGTLERSSTSLSITISQYCINLLYRVWHYDNNEMWCDPPDYPNSILVHFINHVLSKIPFTYFCCLLDPPRHLNLLLGGVLPQPLHQAAQLPGPHQAASVRQGVKSVHDQDDLVVMVIMIAGMKMMITLSPETRSDIT